MESARKKLGKFPASELPMCLAFYLLYPLSTIERLQAYSDKWISQYVEKLKWEDKHGTSPTNPSRYQQLRLVVATVRNHVNARLAEGWRRHGLVKTPFPKTTETNALQVFQRIGVTQIRQVHEPLPHDS